MFDYNDDIGEFKEMVYEDVPLSELIVEKPDLNDASEYNDQEDFYFDNEDEFEDYEDAEDYWEEYH